MESEKIFSKDTLHHAYVLYGNIDLSRKILFDFLSSELSVSKDNNPDFFHYQSNTVPIDIVREIVLSSTRKSFSEKKIYVIEFDTILVEAQNALLKVLEEPNPNTHFFFLTESRNFALETIKSRVVEISMPKEDAVIDSDSEDFISGTIVRRFDIATRISKDKDRKSAERIIRNILISVRENKEVYDKKFATALFHALLYVNIPSSSVKMILEHIAMLLPAGNGTGKKVKNKK